MLRIGKSCSFRTGSRRPHEQTQLRDVHQTIIDATEGVECIHIAANDMQRILKNMDRSGRLRLTRVQRMRLRYGTVFSSLRTR